MKKNSQIINKIEYAMPFAATAFSAFISFLLLMRRNLYEDEVQSFEFIRLPVKELVTSVNAHDISPPGMYLLSKFSYLLTNSARYATILPLIFWFVGLLVFMIVAMRLLVSRKAKILFCFLCAFHPHLLMWINSIRWYPYFSGIALALIAVMLCELDTLPHIPHGRIVPRFRTNILLGIFIGMLFYISYLSVVYAFWFIIFYLIVYGLQQDVFKRLMVMCVMSVAIAFPQIQPFFQVHLRRYVSFHVGDNILVALGRIMHGLSVGEAIMPWHIITPLVLLVILLPPMISLTHYLVCNRKNFVADRNYRKITALTVFSIGIVLTGGLSQFGMNPRCFIFLIPVVVLLIARGAEKIKKMWWWVLVIIIVCIWTFVGSYNLFSKQRTAKGGINDPLDKIALWVIQTTEQKPTVIFVHEPSLTYVLNKTKIKKQLPWVVCSTHYDYINDIPPGIAREITPEYAIVVEGYIGALKFRETILRAATKKAKETIHKPAVIQMGYDPDAFLKTKITGEQLPQYRFYITYGKAKKKAKFTAVGQHFFNVLGAHYFITHK
jgi:hypothetical protein